MTNGLGKLTVGAAASTGGFVASYAFVEQSLRFASLIVGLLCGLFVLAGHLSRMWPKVLRWCRARRAA